jgi:hypothetical protein
VLFVGYEAEKQSCPASPRSSSPRPGYDGPPLALLAEEVDVERVGEP